MPEDLSEHPLRDTGDAAAHARRAHLVAPIAMAVVGALLMFAGYWGASDSTNPGEQIPHLASGTIPGAVLVIAAAVMYHRLESTRAREEAAGVAARLDALVEWLAAGVAEEPPGNSARISDAPARR